MEPGFLAWLMRQAGNHLWQSTAFAAVAFLVVVALRATHARARYWVWLAASVKFLVPFGVLASLGGVIGSWIVPAAPAARIPFAVEQVVQPFALPQETVPVVAAPAPSSAAFPVAAVLLAVWFIGFAAVLFRWWNRWRHVRAAVRAAMPVREGREADALRRLGSEVGLVSSDARLEPGTFGILRPVLWLPAGIADRLSEAELDAILAHELCHARRRDNLWAAVHMAVEAIFWFHPLVWWLGARLIEERERACDEEVVRLGSEPQAYAEGVLKVCEFYLESPVACVAGVTGADLRKRIEDIMTSRVIGDLRFWKKVLLAALLAATVVCPLLFGVVKGEAKTAQSGDQSPKFEVASVKRVRFTGDRPVRRVTPGSLRYSRVTLGFIVERAYEVLGDRIVGLDKLVGSGTEVYDVAATFPKGAQNQVPAMLRTLLEERFRLQVHWETRDTPVFALVVDKDDLKLRTSSRPATNTPWMGDNRGNVEWKEDRATIQKFSDVLSLRLQNQTGGRPVVNMTGVEGEFEFDFEAQLPGTMVVRLQRPGSPERPTSDVDSATGTPLSEALKKMGLKLEPRRMPIKFLIVDEVTKTPTEN